MYIVCLPFYYIHEINICMYCIVHRLYANHSSSAGLQYSQGLGVGKTRSVFLTQLGNELCFGFIFKLLRIGVCLLDNIEVINENAGISSAMNSN